MALTIDDKPWYVGLAIGLVIAALIVFAIHYLLIGDINAQIRDREAKLDELSKKIEQGRSAEKKLPQFREEVKRLELELEKLRRILPSSRNTEEIIKRIKSLVDQGNFVLSSLVFPELSMAPGSDVYTPWPIQVRLSGGYHDLAILFARLANYPRIINVEQVKITALPPPQSDRTITTEFVAKTFVYVENEPQAEGQPGGGQ
jgi:type IV pilus assembly protein PilO